MKRPPPPEDSSPEMSLDLDVLDAVTPDGRAIRLDITAEDLDGVVTETELVQEEPANEPPPLGPRRIP